MCCIGMLGLAGVPFHAKMTDKKAEWPHSLHETSEVDPTASSPRFWQQICIKILETPTHIRSLSTAI